jgi:hypothetical protein
MNVEKVNRLIHYYELKINFNPEFNPSDGNQFRELFSVITKLARDRHSDRYQYFGEKIIFIHEILINPDQKIIYGKLRCIRKDLFPELMNTLTDEPRGIDAKEEEGIVESTHFALYDNGRVRTLALEYNLYGAKINDFALYVERIGFKNEAVLKVNYSPIVKDQLSSLQDRLGRCAEFEVKVHKENIEAIQDIDYGTYSALKASVDQFKTDYATLKLNFEYKIKTSTPEINNSIMKFIRELITNKEKVELFDTLKIVSEDSEHNNKLVAFDLLVDKLKSQVKVEKKVRHRSIITLDMFGKMYEEMIKKRII